MVRQPPAHGQRAAVLASVKDKPFGGAEEAPSLTLVVRDGDGDMRSGRNECPAARVEQKNKAAARKVARCTPLTTKAPYKPYAGKPHVRFWAGGVR